MPGARTHTTVERLRRTLLATVTVVSCGTARAELLLPTNTAQIVAPKSGLKWPVGQDLHLLLSVLPGTPAGELHVQVGDRVVPHLLMRADAGCADPDGPDERSDGTGDTARPSSPAKPELHCIHVAVPLPSKPGEYLVQTRLGSGPPGQGITVEVARPDADHRLIVLAIGVSDYRSADLRLKYPAKDAADLVAVLKRQAELKYSSVQSRLLTDGDAQRRAIDDGLDWLRRTVKPDDVTVLFLSGHGLKKSDVKSGGATYYFLPFDADLANVSASMVSQTKLKDTIATLPGRVVVMLDTCFSGAALANDQFNVDDFATYLVPDKNRDRVVMASSKGNQLSQESQRWANGAFTKAVVEGLSGAASSPWRPQVSVLTLHASAQRRVAELTGGDQTPNLAANGFVDFDIGWPTQPPAPQANPLAHQAWFWSLLGVTTSAIVAGALTVSLLPSPR